MFHMFKSGACLTRDVGVGWRSVATSLNYDRIRRLVHGILAGDRGALSRAITLVESTKREHHLESREILSQVLYETARKDTVPPKTFRVGITGPPGAGKSTLIEALGKHLTAQNKKVGVLAIDPSSAVSGGSLLGDKTRMMDLSTSPNAFIRPSPTRGVLGGVSAYTFDVLCLTEAAGFDITLIETVGVGQSETVVGDIADVLCLVVPPGGGDQLQGIKKGIVEVADLVAVNKADGPFLHAARNTAKDYRDALHLLRPRSDDWTPEVVLVSAIENKSIDKLWEKLEEFQKVMNKKGIIEARRRHRRSEWLWSQLKEELITCVIQEEPLVHALLEKLRAKVILGEMTPRAAAEEIVQQMIKK